VEELRRLTEKTTGDTVNTGDLLSSLPLRLSRTKVLEIGALTVIIVVAILVRVLPIQYGAYYTAYDPLFQYRSTKYVADNGFAAWYSWHDDLSWYPMGRDIPETSYPGIPFSAAFIYMVLKSLGAQVSVYGVGLYFPILMAAITCIMAYYFGKEVKGTATGLFAAAFLAINPTSIARSSLGFFDTETIGLFGMVTTGLMFLKATDAERSLEQRIIFGVLSGLSLGYVFASWGAAKYLNGLLILYMLVLMYTERFQVRHLTAYGLTLGIGYAIVALTPRLGLNSLMSVDYLVGFGLVFVMLIYEYLKDKIDIRLIANVSGALIIVGIIALFLLPAIGVNIPIGFKFLKVMNPFTSTDSALYNSVAENKTVAWSSFFQNFGLVIILSIAGVFFSVKEQNDKNLYLSLFFLTGLYFAGVMARLSQILAAPACIMGAYGLASLSRPFIQVEAREDKSRKGKRRRRGAVYGVDRRLGLVFIVLLIVGVSPMVFAAISNGDQPTSIASSGIPYMFNNQYPKDWLNALEWMKANVSDNELICSWWDYGYWIEAMAGKTTMADGATQTEHQIANIAKIMMWPQNESIKILEKYGADYIVVFTTFNPNDPTSEWPWGDNAKWPQMVLIGGFNMSDFVNYSSYPQQYTEKYYNSTIANLMGGTPNTQYFSLAYRSTNGYVLIYKISYPE
jgi:dolichyl-diphosphooligosaccharide--protein glycosyltransferase